MKLDLLGFLFTIALFSQRVEAASVDTVEVSSSAMIKKIKAVVITPADYAKGKDFPVVYLLHGFGDTYRTWATNVPSIKEDADTYHFIIVCPDGNRSWYFDSPIDPAFKYETFVSQELVSFIDKNYKTKKDRTARGITGLSMGGHGGLYLSFRHQDLFGVAGTMSGGVDIRPFPNNWDLALRLGAYAQNPDNWEKNTVVNLLHLLTPNSLSLIIDCGTEDFFFKVNEQLHQKLMERNIPHDYIARPGMHNWNYWSNGVHYQLLFMHQYFTRAMTISK
jgi:S-formylglutathione hydrolase FrmB